MEKFEFDMPIPAEYNLVGRTSDTVRVSVRILGSSVLVVELLVDVIGATVITSLQAVYDLAKTEARRHFETFKIGSLRAPQYDIIN